MKDKITGLFSKRIFLFITILMKTFSLFLNHCYTAMKLKPDTFQLLRVRAEVVSQVPLVLICTVVLFVTRLYLSICNGKPA